MQSATPVCDQYGWRLNTDESNHDWRRLIPQAVNLYTKQRLEKPKKSLLFWTQTLPEVVEERRNEAWEDASLPFILLSLTSSFFLVLSTPPTSPQPLQFSPAKKLSVQQDDSNCDTQTGDVRWIRGRTDASGDLPRALKCLVHPEWGTGSWSSGLPAPCGSPNIRYRWGCPGWWTARWDLSERTGRVKIMERRGGKMTNWGKERGWKWVTSSPWAKNC